MAKPKNKEEYQSKLIYIIGTSAVFLIFIYNLLIREQVSLSLPLILLSVTFIAQGIHAVMHSTLYVIWPNRMYTGFYRGQSAKRQGMIQMIIGIVILISVYLIR